MSNHADLCKALCPCCQQKAEAYFSDVKARRVAGLHARRTELAIIAKRVAELRATHGYNSIPEFAQHLRVKKRLVALALTNYGRQQWRAQRRWRVLKFLIEGMTYSQIRAAMAEQELPVSDSRINAIKHWGLNNGVIRLEGKRVVRVGAEFD